MLIIDSKKNAYLLFIMLFFLSSVYSQDNDFRGWSEIEYNLDINNNISLALSQHFRLKEDLNTVDSYITESEITFSPLKKLKLSGQLRYYYRNDNSGGVQGFENMYRYRLGIEKRLNTAPLNFELRLAYQNRVSLDRENRFKKGDEAIIQSLCWSTSLWPLVQAGLKIKFVDINPKTLNVDADELLSKVTNKTKVIMLVNVLGLSSNIKKIKNFCKKKNIILIEDNCESLGSTYNKKYMGTFGDFGTFSFFYSHQITSGEGGMIVCNNEKDYKILKSLRSHGWSRDYNESKKYPHLDPRYIFLNSGFNLIKYSVDIANLKKSILESFNSNELLVSFNITLDLNISLILLFTPQ